LTIGEGRESLIDVSRLIWRSWRGRAATGIDRVCLAYLERFGPRSQAVIKRRGHVFVLSAGRSDRLRSVLLGAGQVSKLRMLSVLIPAIASARRSPPREGMTYLNVGHTGLDERSLPRWIRRNKLRAIYLIHDVIPLTHPEYCRPGEAAKHRRRMRNALASASGVIANSRYTRDELAGFAKSEGMHMPPIVEAWLGTETMRARGAGNPNNPPYFVTVGTIEARKNHLLLLDVWDRLLQSMDGRTPQLLIVGSRGWEAKEALQRLDRLGPLHRHVREINGCTDRELAGWIAGARGLLMPSFVEGFGLPVVEALSLGTPVIASNLSVFREIAGDIPTYLEPTDRSAWEMTVRSFCEDCPERNRQVGRIAAYKPPSWDDHFRIVDEWLGRLPLRRFGPPDTIEG
jgi:hypothetical protein